MTNLMQFILNVDSIAGTKIEKFIELGIQEKAPEVYKPRKGLVGRNNDKFSPAHFQMLMTYAPELIKNLDYEKFMVPELTEIPEPDLTWIENFNKENLAKSKFNLTENENITSLMINMPELLLRKKTTLYPEGRTSYRFKRELRKLVTVVGKTMFGKMAMYGNKKEEQK
jgi:hypothetical protein